MLFFFLSCLFLSVSALPEYVDTPHGPRLKECVYQFPKDTTIGENPNGTVSVEYNNGTNEIITPPAQCHADMERLMKGWQSRKAEPNGWLDNAGWYPPSEDISKFTGTYTVPARSPAKGGATLYYFIGLENKRQKAKVNIIQPVLAHTKHGWSFTSWICCPNNITTTGNAVKTKAGATIHGSMERNNDYTWTVRGENENGDRTNLKQKVGDYKYKWADVTMEEYGYTTCSQSPKGPMTFSDMKIYDRKGTQITPEWKPSAETMCKGTLIVKSPTEITIEHSTA